VNAQQLLSQHGNAMEKAVTHQVQRALVQHLPTGEKMMVLRLTPPELGTVRIELIERQGVMSARFHAEDDGVRLALERFLPTMRAELRASDAPIRELSLTDQADFQRSFADGQQQQHAQDGAQQRRSQANQPQFSLDGSLPETPLVARVHSLGGTVNNSSVDVLA
jgi:flagellar hook-length control protein FliK